MSLRERTVSRWLRQLGSPRALVHTDTGQRSNPGWCACCRTETEFVEVGAWLRDQYLCGRCHSIPRQRAVNLALDSYFPAWEDSTIHESSPSNDFVGRYSRHYSRSYFFDDVPLGQEREGERCEDLERLTFDDHMFDLFVTQDVLEHVLRPDRAVREVMRVLKPHGAHIFTTPKHKNLTQTRQRVSLEAGIPVHLLEAHYHGNPIGDGRALVTWDYGDDFEQYLWDWCGYPTVTYVTRDRSRGLDGEYLEVFVTRKVERPSAG
jgi:SAM-dependent methyltransferase